MSDLGKNLDEQSYHSRADRRFTQGTVTAVDPGMQTCTLEVGATDVTGNPVLLEEVPYQGQTPPSVGDNLALTYSNASPHSVMVGGGVLTGQNTVSSLQVIGAVTSLAPASGGSALQGPVLLAGASGVTVTQSGQTITITCGAGSISPLTAKGDLWGYDTANDRVPVGSNGLVLTANSAAALGVSWAAAPVTSVNGSTGAVTLTVVNSLNGLTGALSIVAGSGVSVSASGSDVTVSATGAGVSVEANGGAAVGPETVLNFIAGSNTSVSAVNNTGAGRVDVTVTSNGGGGQPVWPVTVLSSSLAYYSALDSDTVIFCYTETTALALALPAPSGRTGKIYEVFDAYQGATQGITVSAASGSVVGITSIRNGTTGTARLSASYISDGNNWHSFRNSAGN